MKLYNILVALVFLMAFGVSAPLKAADVCEGYGPQTPRDISQKIGQNTQSFSLARTTQKMNLCNIHFHKNAEHKGPGFSLFAGKGKYGGYQCNNTASLTKAELSLPKVKDPKGICKGIKPGDTIEVHWVHSSCKVKPGKGLGACLSSACANPELRVEAKTFLVVNDSTALDFNDFAYGGTIKNGFHQAKKLPSDKDKAVLFAGSTTGPKYTQKKCSPLQVTWNVRPNCAKVDITSLNKWCAKNIFEENNAHGVRQLVTAPELLSPIK